MPTTPKTAPTAEDLRTRLTQAQADLVTARREYADAAFAVESGDKSASMRRDDALDAIRQGERRAADISAAIPVAERAEKEAHAKVARARQRAANARTAESFKALVGAAEKCSAAISGYIASYNALMAADAAARLAVSINPIARSDLMQGFSIPRLVEVEITKQADVDALRPDRLPPGASGVAHVMARTGPGLTATFKSVLATVEAGFAE